ncbi:hypothetical protein BDZ45DRAFT_480492 [Acephala macrosclerotiorum]|nr:hypothetical protein BDZ45DRAFT_480492 [Acephala macrosclerotiorum]
MDTNYYINCMALKMQNIAQQKRCALQDVVKELIDGCFHGSQITKMDNDKVVSFSLRCIYSSCNSDERLGVDAFLSRESEGRGVLCIISRTWKQSSTERSQTRFCSG